MHDFDLCLYTLKVGGRPGVASAVLFAELDDDPNCNWN